MQEEDGHTFYVKCDYEKELFIKSFEALLERIGQYVNDKIITIRDNEVALNYVYRLNYLMRGDKPAGYSYIYVKDNRIFNILMNRNPNGTDRVKYVEIPTIHEDKELNTMNSLDNWVELIEDLPVLQAESLEALFVYDDNFTMLPTMEYGPNRGEYSYLLCTRVLPTDIDKEDIESYLSYYENLQYNLHIVTVKSNTNLRFAYLVVKPNDKTIFYLYQMLRLFILQKNEQDHKVGFTYVKDDNYYINRFSFIDPNAYKQVRKHRSTKRK